MQMMHSLSHCLHHPVDEYRNDSNTGETTDVKLLARLQGVYVCYTLCVNAKMCLCERQRQYMLASWPFDSCLFTAYSMYELCVHICLCL